MKYRLVKGLAPCGAFVVATACLAVLTLIPSVNGQPAAGGMVKRTGPAEDFIKLGIKFDGAQSCSNAQCHGAATPKAQGATTVAEFTKWSSGDKHKTAFETLANDASAKIAKGLKITDATTSDRCLSCHGLSVPKNLQGKQFNVEEGVTCDSCHGPSSKWLDPHSKAGWTEQQRAATKTHDALLKQWGLFDTKSPIARADKCTSCHLSIDADMVSAGHPQPVFELNYYAKSSEKGGLYEGQHWRDPNTPFYQAQLWTAGQIVGLRDAMLQVQARAGKNDPAALKSAYDQAMGYYSVFPGLVAAGAVPANSGIDAAVKQLGTAVTGKNAAAAGQAAGAAAAAAEKAIPAVSAWKPTQANVVAAMQAIAGNAAAAGQAGKGGADYIMQQQGYGLYGLYSGYATTAKPANGAALEKSILDTLFADGLTPESFSKALAGLKAQLPKS